MGEIKSSKLFCIVAHSITLLVIAVNVLVLKTYRIYYIYNYEA